MAFSVAVFFIYTGIEAAAGIWTYSLLTQSRGIAPMTAGMWVSIYWGSLSAGRFLFGVVAKATRIDGLLRTCSLSLAAGAALVWLAPVPNLAFLGFALIGLSAAPIFPSLIATTPNRLGEVHTAKGVGLQIAAGVLGQSLLPAALGLLAGRFGLETIGPALLAGALVLCLFLEKLVAASPSGPSMKSAAMEAAP